MVSSIIRPAAEVFADEFIRRAQGQRYTSVHPALDEVLAETHGIMVYQRFELGACTKGHHFAWRDNHGLQSA